MRRKHPARIVVALSIAVLIPTGIAWGWAGTRSLPGTRLSCLDWSARTRAVSTTSTAWTDVPGMKVKDVLAQNFAVQLSANLNGSDVQLRVMDATVGGTDSLLPTATTVRVPGVPTGFSFTWVGSNPSEHGHTLRLQWRLPAAGSATLTSAAMTLLYQGAPNPSRC